jgi:hypothetical protein
LTARYARRTIPTNMAIEVAPPKPPAARNDISAAGVGGGWPRFLLASLLLALLPLAFFPWQRACTFSSIGGRSVACWSAGLFSGSGGAIGALAGVLILIVVARMLTTPSLEPFPAAAADWALLGAVCAAGIVKTRLVLAYDARLLPPATVPVAARLGAACLGIATLIVVCLAVAAISRARLSDRRWGKGSRAPWLWLLVGATVVAAVGVPYQVSGLGRWGGPVGSTLAQDGGGAEMGYARVPAGVSRRISGLVYVRNEGRVALTLDRVELVDATPGLRLVGAYAPATPACWSVLDEESRIGSLEADPCATPVLGRSIPWGKTPPNDVPIVLVVTADRVGVFRFTALRIRYHVGPLRYTTVRSLASGICTLDVGCGG